MEVKLREALALSDGSPSGLFNETLAVLIYLVIALALIVPPLLERFRGEPDTPQHEREKAMSDS